MPAMQTTQISKDWTIAIPKHLRSRMGFQIGASLEVEDTDGGIIIRPPISALPKIKRIEDYIGCLQTDKPFNPEAEREAAIQGAIAHATRKD